MLLFSAYLLIPSGLNLPPGPPGKPVVGHFFEISKAMKPTFGYDWKEKYGLFYSKLLQPLLTLSLSIDVSGNIVSTNSFGTPIIFVYSDEIARELFEKRGACYSDRPPFHLAML